MSSSLVPGQLVRVKTFTPKELKDIREKKPNFTIRMDTFMDHLGVVLGRWAGGYGTVAHTKDNAFFYDPSWVTLLDPMTCSASAEEIANVMNLYVVPVDDLLPPGTRVQCAENIPEEKLCNAYTKHVSGKKFTVASYIRSSCSYRLIDSEGTGIEVERWFVSRIEDDDDDGDDDILRAITETEAKFTAEIAVLKEKLGKRKRE